MVQTSNSRFGGSGRENFSDFLKRLDGAAENPSQFLANLLAVQCYLGRAERGTIIRGSNKGSVDVIAVYPQLERTDTPPAWLLRCAELVQRESVTDSAVVRPLEQSAEGQSAAGYVVMVSTKVAGVDKAVTAFCVDGEDEAGLKAKSEQLQLLVGLSDYSEARGGQVSSQGSLRRLQQAMEIVAAVNRQDKFVSAAMALCNEIASQWKCERASLGFLEGRYVRLKAMSHTEDFSRKMEVIQSIESAMEECLDQNIEILSPAPGEVTYIRRSADELARLYGPQAVVSLPLRRNGETIGVLTLERAADKPFSVDEIEIIRLACELCTARMNNLYEYDRWFGAAIASKTRNFLANFLGPEHTWAKVIAILCFAAVLFLIFAKGQFRAKAPFLLEAIQQQVVPAPFDGYIKNVEVEVGQEVQADSSVLGGLDTAELRLQLAAAKAEKSAYLKQASAHMRDNETAQAQIANANADESQARIDLLNYQIGQANLISPIDGIVVKGDLKRQIGAPVKTGDILFEVCPLESLRAQLMVPEDLIFDIKTGQEGRLATASYPGKPIKFVVERINPIAEVVNQRNVFKVRVRLVETYPWMRPGMEGIAKVSVGKRRYIWIWTRKITNWLRMKLWL